MNNYENRIKELRNERGMNQKQLAEKVGIDRTTVIKHEKNNQDISGENLIEYSKFFNCSIDYLLGRTEDSTAETENIITVSSRLVQKTQEEPKTDGITSEFFKVFKALDWSDKIDAMQSLRDRMRKIV